MKTRLVILSALAGATLLSACGDIPDYRRGYPIRSGGGSAPAYATPEVTATPLPGAGGYGAPGMGAPSASVAENACLAAGRDAGFTVSGVTGTQEVTGAGGMASSRDVMLGVSRGGRNLNVRCSYDYASASARIMTL